MGSSVEQLRSQMQSAESVLERLDLEMEGIRFDPLLPASVDAAIAKVDRVVETLMAPFRCNPILGPLTDQLKSQYLEGIALKVRDARGRRIRA